MTQAGKPQSNYEKKENGGDKITITMEEYEHLTDTSIFMDCLIDAGVDNWEGYNDALDEYYDRKGIPEFTNDDP